MPWDDASGEKLIDWLGVAEEQFRDHMVRIFRRFIPERFPLVHPSPLNFRWQARNPWFISEVLPELRTQVRCQRRVKTDPLLLLGFEGGFERASQQ